MGVDFTLLRAMVADVARETATTGLRHGASCYSISNITLKLSMGAGAWFALSAIAAMSAGEAAPAADDLERQAMMLRALYAFVPMIMGALALLVLGMGSPRVSKVLFSRPAKNNRGTAVPQLPL